VLVLLSAREWLRSSSMFKRLKTTFPIKLLSRTKTGLIACFVFISPILIYTFLPRIPAYFETLDHNKQLTQIGAYIDQNTDGHVMTIALDYEDTQLLPGVSANTRLISFREEIPFNGFNETQPLDEIQRRIDASNTIVSFDQKVPVNERCSLIKQFEIKYILVGSDDAGFYINLISTCNLAISSPLKTKDLVLLEIK
jgi:hypothetical protein